MMRYLLATIIFACAFIAHASEKKHEIEVVLNNLHHYAATANYEEYFALYTDNAIFIGTDSTEVWDKSAFQHYARPHFNKGKGWVYTPKERHIYLSPNEDVAWFDELLINKSLGLTRGSGVLINSNGKWKITQYHLTIPIPNNLAKEIADQIQVYREKGS